MGKEFSAGRERLIIFTYKRLFGMLNFQPRLKNKIFFINLLKTDITSVIMFLIILSSILALLKPSFATMFNMNVIAKAFSITAIVGLAQMVIIASGGMNLSVGAIGGLAAVLTGASMEVLGFGAIVSVLVGLIVGGMCGLLNGWLIARAGAKGAASFLVTLAMASVYTGINLGITGANPYYNLVESFTKMGSANFLGMPIIFFIMIIIAILVGILFRFTGLGKQILAMGSNMHAAELYGISIRKTVIIANIISGVLAASAAILLVARIGSAQTDIGKDWMLFSFAAPIIGGTRQAGGKVNVFGAVLGALILLVIQNGLVHLSIDIYWMTFIQGFIILLAVAIDRIRVLSSIRKRSEA